MTVVQLKEEVKSRGFAPGKLRKAELIGLLLTNANGATSLKKSTTTTPTPKKTAGKPPSSPAGKSVIRGLFLSLRNLS